MVITVEKQQITVAKTANNHWKYGKLLLQKRQITIAKTVIKTVVLEVIIIEDRR